MKERPILFSGPMILAILDGRKTMTRRVIKRHPLIDAGFTDNFIKDPDNYVPNDCPFGVPGDRLWVREAWAQSTEGVIYRANAVGDDSGEREGYWVDKNRKGDEWFIPGKIKWRPSIHMSRSVSRITLEITGVRVARVQDISEEDCLAEGILMEEHYDGSLVPAYSGLWESLNAKSGFGWDANPWVWVIEFGERTKTQ
jgi:hypothetical protein